MNALGLLRTALAAVETPGTQRAVGVFVFRGSNHRDHSLSFHHACVDAGFNSKVEHAENNEYNESEVRVSIRGTRSELHARLKKLISWLQQFRGLFWRQLSNSDDVCVAPFDFKAEDVQRMLKLGELEDRIAHGAAEPQAYDKGHQFNHSFLVRLAPGKKPADVKNVMRALYKKLADHAIYIQYHRLPRANSGSEYECVFSSEKSDTVKAVIAVMRALAMSGVVSRFRLPGSTICRRAEVIAPAGDESAYKKLAEERSNSIKDMP